MTTPPHYTTESATPVKVTVGSDGVSGVVVQIDDGPSEFGPSWRFFVITEAGELVTFTENKPRVDRQLEHLKMAKVEDMLLQTLRFWKKATPKDANKGYLNIDRVFVANATTATAKDYVATNSVNINDVPVLGVRLESDRKPLEERRAAAVEYYKALIPVAVGVIGEIEAGLRGTYGGGFEVDLTGIDAIINTIITLEERL